MTSQLHNNFQASQAMQGVDDVTTLFFRIGRPLVDILIYYRGLECPTLLN